MPTPRGHPVSPRGLGSQVGDDRGDTSQARGGPAGSLGPAARLPSSAASIQRRLCLSGQCHSSEHLGLRAGVSLCWDAGPFGSSEQWVPSLDLRVTSGGEEASETHGVVTCKRDGSLLCRLGRSRHSPRPLQASLASHRGALCSPGPDS